MEVDIRDGNDGRTFIMRGKMTFDDNTEFRGILEGIGQDKPKACTFDMSDLVGIDSAGLGLLVLAHDTAKENHIPIRIRNPQGHVKKMLSLSKFDELIPIV